MKHEAEKNFCPLGNIPNLHRARELVQCPSCPFPFAQELQGQPWPSTKEASPSCNEHIFGCACVLPDVCAGMHILLGTKQEVFCLQSWYPPKLGQEHHFLAITVLRDRKLVSNYHLLCRVFAVLLELCGLFMILKSIIYMNSSVGMRL